MDNHCNVEVLVDNMIPLFILLTVTGVCAPFDATDCEYTVIIIDSNRAWGHSNWDSKTIHFSGDFYNERDCWGMRIWEHEWLHMAYGNYHLNGLCMLRGHGPYA